MHLSLSIPVTTPKKFHMTEISLEAGIETQVSAANAKLCPQTHHFPAHKLADWSVI